MGPEFYPEARFPSLDFSLVYSGPVVSYSIGICPDLDLELSFTVVLDQMEVSFDGCVVVVEEAAYMSPVEQTSRHEPTGGWRRSNSHEPS